MNISVRYIYTLLMIVVLILSLFTTWYIPLVFCLFGIVLVMVIEKIGYGVVLRESTAILYVLICLVMPAVGYLFYTSENELAKVWGKFMPVPQNIYFGFTLPAITCFTLALTWPLGLRNSLDEGKPFRDAISKMQEILPQKRKIAMGIIIVGFIVGRLVNFLPGGIQFFATLIFFASFAGLLYIFFTPNFRFKRLVLIGFLIAIFYNALVSGMFTIVAYMGVTIFSFFLINSGISLLKKVLLLLLSISFMIVLQNTKLAYRKVAWDANYTGSRSGVFGEIFLSNIQKGDLLLENRAFFNMYVRTNQGFNVALVMKRIPVYQDFDGGDLLGKAFASAFVPRFLWPDKPEAGGRFNMKHYAGYVIKGWSTNIGPLGEAYGSFGVTGGIIYMLLLGAFIRWAYKCVFVLNKRFPLLICWIPVLFFQITYSGETDSLQIMNSLIKSAVFIWLLYKIYPALFCRVVDTVRKKKQPLDKAMAGYQLGDSV